MKNIQKLLTEPSSQIITSRTVTRTLHSLNTSRVRTESKEPNMQVQNIEDQLAQLGYQSQFLKRLFVLKCTDNQVAQTQQKYRIFLKGFYSKLENHRKIIFDGLNLKQKSFDFLIANIHSIGSTISVDLSGCNKQVKLSQILQLIQNKQRLLQLFLRNLELKPDELNDIIDLVSTKPNIIKLDISNRGGDHLNRLSQSISSLYRLIENTKTLMFLELEGLNLKDSGVQFLQRAIINNSTGCLLSLNLKNNGLTKQSYAHLQVIMRKSNIEILDLSENPLNDDRIQEFGQINYSKLSKLNLSRCMIQSKGIYKFFEQIKNNKNLKSLILDGNDFSSSWFNKVGLVLRDNNCLEELSLAKCKIREFEEFFEGIIDNKSLKKLDVSYNSIDKYDAMDTMLKNNKTLVTLKMKFCYIDDEGGLILARCLRINEGLKHLDLTGNFITAVTGNRLLEVLIVQNRRILEINLDKTQIEFRVKRDISVRLKMNNFEESRHTMEMLRKESAKLTIKKIHQDALDTKELELKRYLRSIKQVVESLNTKIADQTKKCQQQSNMYDVQLTNLNKKCIDIQIETKTMVKRTEYQISMINKKIEQRVAQKKKQMQVLDKLTNQLQQQQKRVVGISRRVQNINNFISSNLKRVTKRSHSANPVGHQIRNLKPSLRYR